MTQTQKCRDAGLRGSTELQELTGVAASTLRDWHLNEDQTKFKLAIDAALYRKGKR